jgi:hypothetical protein
VYELYCDPEIDKSSDSVTQVGSPESQRNFSLAKRFRRMFSGKDEEALIEETASMAESFNFFFSVEIDWYVMSSRCAGKIYSYGSSQ